MDEELERQFSSLFEAISEATERINEIKSMAYHLHANLKRESSLSKEGDVEEAQALVTKALGATEVEPDEPAKPDELDGDTPAALRFRASQKAATGSARPLTRNFRPSTVGYTSEDFKRDYPDVNPGAVLESFLSHHISKGDVSRNWMEKFFSYSANAQRIHDEKPKDHVETDSMGLPTDRKQRRQMLGQDGSNQ